MPVQNINSLLDLISASLYPGMQGGGPRLPQQPTAAPAAQAQQPDQPPPWVSGLGGAAPAGVNLPAGMYYGLDPGSMSGGGLGTGEPARPTGRPAFYSPGHPTEEFIAANMAPPGRRFSPLGYTSQNFDPGQAAADSPGFFRVSDLYPHGGLPPIYQQGAGDLSTDNWRLLGMGPGYILRNGYLIRPSSGDRGFPSGRNPGGGVTAEQGNVVPFIGTGTGTAYGFPNLYAPGYAPGSAGWPSSLNPWQTVFSGNV